ncbi:MAG: translation initiation factor IF-2 [Buchnera aphidicola (Meitanaphis microgallis)]
MEINIKTLANEMKISVEKLVKKCISAGILKNKYDCITYHEKKILDKYLKNTSAILKNTLTLKRKTRSTLSIPNIGGKNKCVQVEIRKRKTYVKHNVYTKRNILQNINYVSTNNKNENNIRSVIGKENDSTIYSIQNTTKGSSVLNNLKQNRQYNNIEKKQHNLFQKIENKNNFSKKIKLKNKLVTNKSHFEEKNTNKVKKSNRVQSNTNHKNYSIVHARRSSYDNNNAEINHRLNHNKNVKNVRNKKNKTYFERKINREYIKRSVYKESDSKDYSNSILQQAFKKPLCAINRDIIIGSVITVSELANKMAIKSSELIKVMTKLGYITTINQNLDIDVAQLVAEEMGHKVTIYFENELETKIMKDLNIKNRSLKIRPPIVTIMGHVDHGKTSLLDYIRLTKIASQEAGGITQHIGAYYITVNNKIITFLDTPGHAAFTAMRARGAKITDIVILVIAADDGIKPQTIEAIQHAQAASVPILVVINKIDKLNLELDKIKNELVKYNIVPEEWGGNNIFVNVSAKSGEGIDDLLKSILLQAEILELKAIPTGMATGLVIESFLDKGQGPIATMLVQEGTLKKGDVVVCGLEYGKVRAIKNSSGEDIKSAGPSIPIKILGLSGIPIVGDKIVVVHNEKEAREVALYRQKKFREQKLSKKVAFKLSNVFEKIKKDNVVILNIVLKSDVQGSLEAISSSLKQLSNNDVKVNIIGKGVGSITETDVSLAMASNAIIIGFNVKADFSAKRIIELENLDLRYYSVIYHIIDEVKDAICGMTAPKYKQETVGLAEIRNIFKSPKLGSIAGCMIVEGIIKRSDSIRILRKNKVIHIGDIESLKRFKEDVNEVRNGVECGIGVKNYSDIRVNDLIEAFHTLKAK